MSEQNNDNPQPPKKRKSPTVPLRKETVRVTLKSTPSGAKGAAPKPMSPMPANTASEATDNHPDVPDVTTAVPLKQETMRVTLKATSPQPAPAKAIDSAPPVAGPPKVSAPVVASPPPVAAAVPAPAPKLATPAPTVPLRTAAPVQPQPTVALATATKPLPQATVQLQQTQQISAPGASTGEQAPTIQTFSGEEEDSSSGSSLLTTLAVVAFVLSLFVLVVQLQRAGLWIDAHEGGSYSSLFSSK